MFKNSPFQIVGHTGVQSSILFVGEDIDIVLVRSFKHHLKWKMDSAMNLPVGRQVRNDNPFNFEAAVIPSSNPLLKHLQCEA